MTETQHSLEQRMLDAAIAAYGVHKTWIGCDSKYWDPIHVDTVHGFIEGSDGIDAAYVATTTDCYAVLGLRGTLSTHKTWEELWRMMLDWWQDDKTRLIPWVLGGEVVHVHKGFHEALMALWPEIRHHLTKGAIDWPTCRGLLIAGHSKGAALTSMAAAMIAANISEIRKIDVYAYAQPLAGAVDFVNWTSRHPVIASTNRYQRAHDIVPFAPPYDSWDIFDHIRPGGTIESHVLYDALQLAGYQMWKGYHLIGDLSYYPGADPSTSQRITGQAAIDGSQKAIEAAVYWGLQDEIAAAHSAEYSYWPALFGKPNPPPTLTDIDCGEG